MVTRKADYGGATFWARNLDEVDQEIARLATICKVRILDSGVIDRVLKNDASVCGSKNEGAFNKLRSALMMHYEVRAKAVDAVGEVATQHVIAEIVERLRKRIGKSLGGQAS
jgi:hypothetical protein